jgi:hypothetical protein
MTTTFFRLNHLYSLVFALIGLGLVAASPPATQFSLAYFRIVDKATYSKAPSKYERVEHRHPVTGEEVYVERQPTLQMLGSGIEAVIVGKEKIYGSSPKDREEMRRDLEAIIKAARKGGKEPQLTYPNGFSYKLTFKLKPLDWKRQMVFFRNNVDQFFYMKVGNRDFGITIIGPTDDEESQKTREFTIYTGTNDANLIKEILSPIKDKVSWEP